MEQFHCVNDALNEFCAMSGQQVSIEKTSIFFSKNVDHASRHLLVRESGYREDFSLGRCLGVRLIGRSPRKEDFNYMVDFVRSKLSTWKAKQLSFAGRVSLSRSVLDAIPIYPMMYIIIPKSCTQEFQWLQHAFMWGEDDDKRKYHAVSRSTMQLPRYLGAFGLCNLGTMNIDCFLKMVWRLHQGEENLWCKVLKGKYGRDYLEEGVIVSKISDSPF